MPDVATLTKPTPDPFLFPQEIIDAMTVAEERGEFTAERLRVRHPHKYAAIIQLRGESRGQIAIGKLLGVSAHTVDAVDEAEPEAIAIVRQRLMRSCGRASAKLLELINTHPEKIPAQSWALSACQLIDKHELLDGRATVRVEEVKRIDIHGDWEQFIERLAGEASGMGLERGENLQIGNGSEVRRSSGKQAGESDGESDDSLRVTVVNAEPVTDFETDSGVQGPAGGAGGGIPPMRTEYSSIGNEGQNFLGKGDS